MKYSETKSFEIMGQHPTVGEWVKKLNINFTALGILVEIVSYVMVDQTYSGIQIEMVTQDSEAEEESYLTWSWKNYGKGANELMFHYSNDDLWSLSEVLYESGNHTLGSMVADLVRRKENVR